MGDQLITLDPPKHTRHRALVGKLFTPNRLKENEEFMWTLAEELIDEFADRGEVEFCHAYAKPFTLLVIADLLGVPREDHETFRGWLGGQTRPPETPKAGRSAIRCSRTCIPTSPATSRSAAPRRATT